MDFRFALRSLRRNPGFALLAVLMMALGIGANTAVFSVVNAVLVRPLAFRDPDRIVVLTSQWDKGMGPSSILRQVSAPDIQDVHDQSTLFESLGYYSTQQASVMTGDAAEYARVTGVSPEFFRVFLVAPMAGRAFSTKEMTPGSRGAVLISESYWREHFGGRSDAMGRTLRIGGKSAEIVGVMAAGFVFPKTTDIWFPLYTVSGDVTKQFRQGLNYEAVARLKPGVTVEQASGETGAITARLQQLFPKSNAGRGIAVTGLRDDMARDVRLTLYLLLGAVGVVLLIACANMATLLLAKATGRAREIAIRAAIGATRARIIRQMITESLVLSMVAGGVGLLFAWWGSGVLVSLAPAGIPRLGETSIDGGVLAFTLGVSILASLFFGLAPALQASGVDLNDALKRGGRAGAGGAAGRLRSALVVAEIAMCVVLLAGAGLLLRSFAALHNVALGFRPERVLVMKTTASGDVVQTNQIFKDVIADAASMPGVIAAGATMAPPGHVETTSAYWLDHLPNPIDMSGSPVVISIVAPGTFGALGIPLRQGRDFDERDARGTQPVAIVNEALVRASFHGSEQAKDPIGRTIFCPSDSMDGMKIVGVVGDVRQYGPAHEPSPECYMPYTQHRFNGTRLSVVMRTTGDPRTLIEAMRSKVRERSAEVPVDFTTMEASLAENIAPYSFRTVLLGTFAALAVILAMAGVYGVMAYAVSQRSGEMGMRMALGASPGDLLRLVMRQGLLLAMAGLAIGLAGAFAATRLLRSMLFEVKSTDPWTYAASALLLGVVTLGACFVPALRASRVDPLVALRQE